MPLNAKQQKRAIAMALDGMAPGMIAAEFRVTRNSVAGYMDRWRKLGLIPTRNTRPPKAEPSPPVQPGRCSAPPPKPDPLADMPIPPPPLATPIPSVVLGAGPAVLALRANDCRWPIGDVDAPDFRFCCDRVRPGPAGQPPYCPTHLRRAVTLAASPRLFGSEP